MKVGDYVLFKDCVTEFYLFDFVGGVVKEISSSDIWVECDDGISYRCWESGLIVYGGIARKGRRRKPIPLWYRIAKRGE